MIHDFVSKWEAYIRKYRRTRRWNQVMAVLMILVLFCTTYALMAPAITMEKKCQIQEHTHCDACYSQVTAATAVLPDCTPQSLEIHRHEAGCFGENSQVVCGYADFVLHHHDAACYDETGTLWCPLPEVEEYRHGDSCYRFPQIHIHQENCYIRTPGERICGLHEHTEDCMTELVSRVCGQEETMGHQHNDDCLRAEEVLICQREETDGHLHEDTCRSEDGELICGEEESEAHHHTDECRFLETEVVCGMEAMDGHRHSEACYQRSMEPACGIESDHIHTEDCCSIIEELTCDLEETGDNMSLEPELICEKEEIVFHCHAEQCFDEYHQLVCGQLQILQHQHSNACFRMEEIPVDTQNLTCTIPEEGQGHSHGDQCRDESGALICQLEETAAHQHSTRCYGTWELICQLPEHTHREDCIPPESLPEETEETVSGETLETVMEEILPEAGSSGLPVMGTAYAMRSYRLMRMSTGAESDDTSEPTGPVDVTAYISDAILEYQTDGGDDWINVQNASDIPGDADFRLTVEYQNIPISALLAAGGQMTYTLPSVFREAIADGVIKDNANQEIGTITANGTTATIVFQEQWLKAQQSGTNTVIGGNFYVTGKINLTEIPEDGETTITIGNVQIQVNFSGDLIAQYGNVDVEKTVAPRVLEEETGDYLQYTLTVTAGPDGCPEVSVVDTFSANSIAFLAKDDESKPQIILVTPEDAEVTVSQTGLTWVIGAMDANATRTLAYKVKLADTYTGIIPPGNQSSNIQNTAVVRSKEYERDSSTATFSPKAGATLSKIGSNITNNPDGSISITYYVWINAYSDNSYVLDNVKIVDSLDGKGSQSKPTDATIRKHLVYQQDSFRFYSGGSKEKTDLNGLRPLEYDERALVWGDDSNNDAKLNDSFTFYAGDLAPGDSKTLVYTLTLEPGVFVAAGNSGFSVQNRVEIKTDETRTDGDQWLNGWTEVNTFARKAWTRKLVGSELEQSQTISMSGDSVYNTAGAAVENPGSFVAPVGSYRYQVLANEAGNWDLSSANLHDSLSAYMQFVGYVRVDAFYVDENAPASNLADSNALAYFQNKTPCKTFWIDIDQLSAFTVNPTKEIVGSAHNSHAFLLTYYAQPVNTQNITQVVVNNTFNLSGTVGIGSYHYELVGISASAGVTVSGSNSFHAEKQAWYYEPPKVTSGDFVNGAIYWAIRVEGNLIPTGTAIRDIIYENDETRHHIRGTSLVGVFAGNLGEEGVTSYRDYGALVSGGNLTALEASAYNVSEDNLSLTLTLTRDLQLGSGQALYMIVKTEPDVLPEWDRHAFTFKNYLLSSSNGENWVDHSGSQLTLYGSENIFKELGRVFRYSETGTKVQDFGEDSTTNSEIITSHLTGSGTYVAWQIHLNYEGTLQGTYRVLEQIPAGMEVAYIRTYWLGNKAVNQNPQPASVPITDLGGAWTAYEKTMSSRNSRNYVTYYYINGQNVILEYQNLFPGGETDQHAVEIQVVCKLTDPDVLMGGQDKYFNNTVRLINSRGEEIGSDSHGLSLSAPGMTKGKNQTATVSGGVYPFVITLNELGTDLMPGTNTITLVDELGQNLIINTGSIQVKNTKTGEILTTGWNSSVEYDADGTQTLKIVLPDDLPLTITYTAIVNAPPGQTVTVTNNAHWEGYTTTQGGSVNDSNYKYEAGGTAGSMSTPQIVIHKTDQYHNQLNLPDAEFSLTEMQIVNTQLTEISGNTIPNGITNAEGILTFGIDAEHLLAYNKIYRIQEVKAPAGYVLDANPHYVLIAQQIQQEDGTKAYPNYDAERAAGVYISYSGSLYAYEARNHKGEIQVSKHFENVDGSAVSSINGTYRFGLFKDEQGTEVVQRTYVTFANGAETVSAKFTNVTLDQPYYVYELDDQGKPILGGDGTVNGIPFVVTYTPQNAVTVTGDSPTAEVTVINRMNYPELPSTGGKGTIGFYILGSLLLSAAAVLLYLKKQNHSIP